MKAAAEAKRKIVEHLMSLDMTIGDVRDWDLHCDDEDGGNGRVFVYYSWHGGGHLSSFAWPWGQATFDAAAYQTFFSNKATANHQASTDDAHRNNQNWNDDLKVNALLLTLS